MERVSGLVGEAYLVNQQPEEEYHDERDRELGDPARDTIWSGEHFA